MEQKVCYIVKVGNPWNYVGYDWTLHVFRNFDKAEEFFNKIKKQKIQETIEDNDMSEEEAYEYRKEVNEIYSSENYSEDPEQEWAIALQEAEVILEEDPLLETKAAIADALIDRMCDVDGIKETIWVLADYCTKEELLALGFNEYDIDQILNEEEN